MKNFRIIVSEEIINTLQKLDFEVKSREFIIMAMLKNQSEINTEAFKKYHGEYVDYFSQFEFAKQIVTDTLVPEALRSHQVEWTIDYASKTLIITQKCDCEVNI